MGYKVLSNLKHDGIKYGLGDVVEMQEKQAQSLVKDGILEETKKQPEKELTEISKMSVDELREIAEEKGLDIKGLKKAELIKAILGK
jgi:ribosomal protein L11